MDFRMQRDPAITNLQRQIHKNCGNVCETKTAVDCPGEGGVWVKEPQVVSLCGHLGYYVWDQPITPKYVCIINI